MYVFSGSLLKERISELPHSERVPPAFQPHAGRSSGPECERERPHGEHVLQSIMERYGDGADHVQSIMKPFLETVLTKGAYHISWS